MTYNGGVVESTDLSGKDQRGRRALHCLNEGAKAGTRDEELGGDAVAAHLPVRPPGCTQCSVSAANTKASVGSVTREPYNTCRR